LQVLPGLKGIKQFLIKIKVVRLDDVYDLSHMIPPGLPAVRMDFGKSFLAGFSVFTGLKKLSACNNKGTFLKFLEEI